MREHRTHTGRARIRAQADTALYFGSDWISLLIILFSVFLFFWGAYYLANTFLWFLSAIDVRFAAPRVVWTVYLILYLLLSPLIPGVLSYAYDLFRAAHGELGGRVPATEIFHCYASPRAMLGAALDVLVQLILFLLPPAVLVAAFYLIRRIPGISLSAIHTAGSFPTVNPVSLILPGFLAILLFIGALYVTSTLSPALFLSVARPELSFPARIKHSFLYMRLHAGDAVFALFRFGILTLASLFLAGIPFFVYLLPHAIFTYIGFSKELSNSISF